MSPEQWGGGPSPDLNPIMGGGTPPELKTGDITKWGYRQATDKRRPPACSIFRDLKHGAISSPIDVLLKNGKKRYPIFFGGSGGQSPPATKRRLRKTSRHHSRTIRDSSRDTRGLQNYFLSPKLTKSPIFKKFSGACFSRRQEFKFHSLGA